MSSSYYENQGGQFRVIPGAGTYLQDQAKAQSAYERAKAQLMAQRQQTQIKSGLNKDYQVDPNSQYGGYQQMLQNQGSELNAANEQAQQRGFFGPGLGNQGESALRYGHAVQALGFKNSLSDYESQYQAQMGDIERIKQAEMLGALQGAAGNAYGDWTQPGYDQEYGDSVYGDPSLFAYSGSPMPGLPNMPGLRPGTVRSAVKATFAPKKKRPAARGAGGTTYRSM